MKSTTENVRQLKGDGLRVSLDINDLNLKVSGDGCRVTVARNCGIIRVVGDGCSLKVNRNDGEIEYKGDGGSILLGVGSRTESVSYVGDGGRISVRSESNIIGGCSSRKPKRSSKKKNEKSECEKEEKEEVQVQDEDRKPLFCSVSDSELELMNLENAANETKEMREKGNSNVSSPTDKRKEGLHLRRSKTIVVTKISTEQIPVNINNNNLIKTWFRSPPSVIRSFKSQPESL